MRVLSDSGTLHVSFACFGSRNATRSLVGQWGISFKMQLQGESWENSGELERTAEICVDLRGSLGSCGEPTARCGNYWRLVGFARTQKKMHGHVMHRRPILGLYYFLTGVFLWLLTGIKWPQISLLEGVVEHKTCLPPTSNQFVAI